MADTKILQTILDKVSNLDQKVDKGFKEVNDRLDGTNNRIDKLGLQLAALEDDAPTVDEFDQLKNRVEKLEKRAPTVV